MRILLINPKNLHIIKSNFPGEIDEKTGSFLPLGLLYIAAFLKSQKRHTVNILDMQAENIDMSGLEVMLKKGKPHIVGIYTTTFNLLDVFLTAREVKKNNPNIHITLGGPHVNIYPEETMLNNDIDSIVLGEGEITFSMLVNALEKGVGLDGVKGIFYRDSGKVRKTSPPEFIHNLDILPFPDRKIFPLERYYDALTHSPASTTMISSRGCPYNCIFCYHGHMGKGIRFRTSGNVVSEMEECLNLGIKDIFFYDDSFTLDSKRTFDICDDIIERGLNVRWSIRTRVDSVDISMLRKLKKAGCERIQFGIEAGNSRILSVLNKKITLSQAEESFKLAKKAGIETLAYFMIGSPEETQKEILETIDFAVKLNPDYAHFSITMPFPDTELYKMGLERNIFKNDFWREFAKQPDAKNNLHFWEEYLSERELYRFLKYAYRRFYFRPGYLLKVLVNSASLGEIKRKMNAGAGLFKYLFN